MGVYKWGRSPMKLSTAPNFKLDMLRYPWTWDRKAILLKLVISFSRSVWKFLFLVNLGKLISCFGDLGKLNWYDYINFWSTYEYIGNGFRGLQNQPMVFQAKRKEGRTIRPKKKEGRTKERMMKKHGKGQTTLKKKEGNEAWLYATTPNRKVLF